MLIAVYANMRVAAQHTVIYYSRKCITVSNERGLAGGIHDATRKRDDSDSGNKLKVCGDKISP